MENLFINNKDIKQMLLLILHKEGIKQQDIINAYNSKFNKMLSKSSFSQMLNNNTIKYAMLIDLLDCIGYQIKIEKKNKQ